MRPLLIGQAPGPNTNPELPLFPIPSTSAGGRLQQLMGLRRWEYLKKFDRVNLLPEFPGRHKRDDKFPLAEARFAATVMRPHLSDRVVIMIGRKVGDAFGLDLPFHQWAEMRCRRTMLTEPGGEVCIVAVVPHTSGRNHWYNSEGNREEARRFWQDLLSGPY